MEWGQNPVAEGEGELGWDLAGQVGYWDGKRGLGWDLAEQVWVLGWEKGAGMGPDGAGGPAEDWRAPL